MRAFRVCFTFFFIYVLGLAQGQKLNDIQFLDSVNTTGIIPNIENRTFVGVKSIKGDHDFDYLGWYSSEDSTVQKDNWSIQKVNKNAKVTILDFEQTFIDALSNNGNTLYKNPNDYWLTMDELPLALRFKQMGKDSLAVAYLGLVNDNMYARTNKAALENLKEDLAWSIYSEMLSYHLTGDFSDTYEYVKIYKERYSEFKVPFQANELVQDLERRKAEGQFSKIILDSLPLDFENWTDGKKILFLISDLDQVNLGSSMFVSDLSGDWRAAELVTLGKVVIEPMLELMESDKRLTRSLHSQRFFSKRSSLRGVEEVALNVIEAVLHKIFHSLPHTSCTYTTSYTDEGKKTVIKEIRKYWEENKDLTVEETLYNTLKNDEFTLTQRKEAFTELVNLPHKKPGGVITISYGDNVDVPINPVIDQFKKPSVGELGLLLCHEEVKTLDSTEKDYRRNVLGVHKDFSRKLVRLNDSSLSTKVSDYISASNDVQIKIIWTRVNLWLNESRDIEILMSQIKKKEILYKENLENCFTNNYLDSEGLMSFFQLLYVSEDKMSRQILDYFFKNKNVFYPQIKRSIFDGSVVGDAPILESLNWGSYDLNYYISLLGDETIIAKIYKKGDYSHLKSPFINRSKSHYYDFNEIAIIDRKEFYDSIDVTYDSWALHKLSTLVLGMPTYHPLEKRPDSSKQAVLNFLSKNYGLRKMDYHEYYELYGEHSWFNPSQYIPIINLEKAATKKGLKKGKALFCLENKKAQKINDVDKYLTILVNGYEVKAMVLQAEQLDGEAYFGVVSQYGTQIITKRMSQTKYF